MHSQSGNAPSNGGPHGHSCTQNCPSYSADSVYLGWMRSADYGSHTRHWYRVFRADRRNHRMTDSASERDTLVLGSWADDDSPGWIFNGSYSCP